MIGDLSISLVMPCRNEASHLPAIIAAVPPFFDEILVVSNASTDGTFEIGLEEMRHDTRLRMLKDDRTHNGIGYGYAHMSGIAAATCDVVVCADCDGTYPIRDAPRLLREMLEEGCAFASCSRYPDPRIPKKLQLGVYILNIEIAMLYGWHIGDSLSGMWVFLRDVVPYLHLTEGDWNLSPQIKLNAHRYLGGLSCELHVRQAVDRLGETKQSYF